MAKYSNTKAKINEKIATNGRQAVTGAILNDVLQTMVDSLGADYQFGGLVQPGSSFTAGEQPVVFLATTPGTYTNFGGLVVADGEVALLVWSGTAWNKQTPDIATRTEVSQLGQELGNEIQGLKLEVDGSAQFLIDEESRPSTQTTSDTNLFDVEPNTTYRVYMRSSVAMGQNELVVFFKNDNGNLSTNGLFGSVDLTTEHYVDVTSTNSVIAHNAFVRISTTGVQTQSTLFIRVEKLASQISLINKVSNLNQRVDELSDQKKLFIGTLVQRRMTASGFVDGTDMKRATMQSAIALPYNGIKLNVKAPSGYYVGIRVGNQAENLSSNMYWYENEEEINIPSTNRYYRISFGKGSKIDPADDIPVASVQTLIDNGELAIFFDDTHNIIRDNKETEKYVRAIMREFYSTASLNNSLPNIPVFAHMSDIHGDAKRFGQFLDYCDFIGVTAALITGDFVALNPSNSCQFINDIADKHSTMVLPCTGNHDVRGLYTAKEQNEQVVGYLMNKNDVTVNPCEGDYPTYYYKDFTTQKIRIIALNVHEGTRSHIDGCNLTQIQAEWFISTLANTPSDYGVLVMFHEPEVQTIKDSQHDTFYQPFGTIYIYQQNGISGAPISKIIDAFISKTTATISYTTQGNSVSVNADFTNVASGVEFISYICGHEHIDWIGTVKNTTNRQLMIDITCGVALYGTSYPYLANLSDLPRSGKGITQDAFNIYGIDRVNKTVRVARIGSNITSEAKDRKCMIIPYAEV